MVNTFTLILVVATIITGILWCLDKFIFARKYYKRYLNLQCTTNELLNRKTLKKVRLNPRYLETISSTFPILVVVLFVRSFIYEPFQIPSGSMMPTLLIGDFILVEKFAYHIKDPIYHKKLIRTWLPKRGDIVVFKYPKDPRINYIKRAIGLPGDKVTYDPIAKEITIQPNFNLSGITCERLLPITYSNFQPSDFIQVFSHYDEINNDFFKTIKEKEIKENSIRLMERKETLGNVTHRILTMPIIKDQLEICYQQPNRQLKTWIVPPKQYFMMGDNRDNSADSRNWGFVPEENLIGRATVIWISFEKREGQWPTGIHLSRIGSIH